MQTAFKGIKRKLKRFFPLYVMMIPGLTYIIINNYIPLTGLQLAFKKFKYVQGIWGSAWNGVKNFTYLFKTGDAWTIIRNTLGYNLVFIILGTLFAIFVAIMLNEIKRKKVQQVYQTVILIPYLISYVIVSYITYAALGESNGMINNSILIPLGMEPAKFYTDPKYWPFILTSVQVWKTFGYSSIIYFASIIGIDKAYYEAATVDGAGTWKQITSITLPLIKPVIITLTLLSIGRIFYSDFGLFYQVPMNTGLLYDATSTIDTYVYRGLLETNDVGRASAAGFIQSVLGFLLVLGTNYAVRALEKDQALF
ncbi:MAG TPA: ABC transporter permease subunit [Candidatus Limiplasma sp.]|nr:ABC transporter permease subunit [Candidatus Limiplasma sp.]HRX09230.1 ABC transporter permease subunit [Candidatus Limiplasma sp.]